MAETGEVMRVVNGKLVMIAWHSGSRTLGVSTPIYCLLHGFCIYGNHLHDQVKNDQNAKGLGNSSCFGRKKERKRESKQASKSGFPLTCVLVRPSSLACLSIDCRIFLLVRIDLIQLLAIYVGHLL